MIIIFESVRLKRSLLRTGVVLIAIKMSVYFEYQHTNDFVSVRPIFERIALKIFDFLIHFDIAFRIKCRILAKMYVDSTFNVTIM